MTSDAAWPGTFLVCREGCDPFYGLDGPGEGNFSSWVFSLLKAFKIDDRVDTVKTSNCSSSLSSSRPQSPLWKCPEEAQGHVRACSPHSAQPSRLGSSATSSRKLSLISWAHSTCSLSLVLMHLTCTVLGPDSFSLVEEPGEWIRVTLERPERSGKVCEEGRMHQGVTAVGTWDPVPVSPSPTMWRTP